MSTNTAKQIKLATVQQARTLLKPVVNNTPFALNEGFSEQFGANIYFKREDLQLVRSYKLRGAYHKMASLPKEETGKGVVCASAGNHAQGVAYSCRALGIHGKIFMPVTTPQQKVRQVNWFGREWVEVILTGDTFDDAYAESLRYCQEKKAVFIHPFDDVQVITGQGTVALEILESSPVTLDYLFVPIGGGGLASGMGSVFRQLSPKTHIIGVQPSGAPSMKNSLERGQVSTLSHIEKFVDGASVKSPGKLTYQICSEVLDDVALVDEGKICSVMLQLYNEHAIVAEPAGALTIGALWQYREAIKGKNVACVISGGNNDITRMEEIKERSLLYEGVKHYFLIRFPQRAGALREFLTHVLGPSDDITFFQYAKKTSRENGPAIVGLEVPEPGGLERLTHAMQARGVQFEHLNGRSDLFTMLV